MFPRLGANPLTWKKLYKPGIAFGKRNKPISLYLCTVSNSTPTDDDIMTESKLAFLFVFPKSFDT